MTAVPLRARGEPTFSMERYTPKLAREILDANNTDNRPLSQGRIEKYAADMTSGRWSTHTGETVKFAHSGRLLDGQHRLTALILANITMEFLTVRGLDEEIFTKIDIGKNRNGKDVLAIDYHLNPTVAAMVATAINMAITYEIPGAVPGAMSNNNLTSTRLMSGNDTLIAYARKNPDVIEAAKFVHENYRSKSLVSRGVLAWTSLETRRIAPAESDAFVLDILEGTGLDSADPVHGLRSVILQDQQAHRKAGRDCIIAGVVKAWNRRRKPPKTGTAVLHTVLIRRDWVSFPRFE